MTQVTLKNFKGLTPAIDRRRISEPYVIEGKNFYVNVDGPISGFGREIVAYKEVASPRFIETFRVNSDSTAFFFTAGAILTYDSIANKLVPVLLFTEPGSVGRWSKADVGGKQYFAREGVGLIQYDNTTGIWTQVTGADVPSNIISITQTGGRLIILAEGLIAWSAIDDGTNLTPSTVTGAGFQSLSIINALTADDPLIVLEYANGFLTYTKSGILRSELVTTVNPFRHRVLSRNHIPLNAFSIIQYRELEHLFVTERGFYTTQGQIPEPWEDLMSEYLRDQVINQVDLTKDAIFSLSQAFNNAWVLFSISENVTPGVYSKAFVFHDKSGQWGSFDRTHTGFVDLPTAGISGTLFDEGYVDSDGTIWRFNSQASDSIFPDAVANPFVYNYQKNTEFSARRELISNAMPSVLKFKTVNDTVFPSSGIYDFRSIVQESFSIDNFPAVEPASVSAAPNEMKTKTVFGTGIRQNSAAAIQEQAALDSFIRVGPIRAGKGEDIDELTSLISLGVGMLGSAVGDTFEDWLNDFSSEVIVDWATITEIIEDWGFSSAATTNFDVSVEGTLDAYTIWENKDIVPSLVKTEGRYQQFALQMTSLYTLVKFAANSPGQNFHLKYLDAEIYPAGRLF